MKQENLSNQKCIFCGNSGGRKMLKSKDKMGNKVFSHRICLEVNKCMMPGIKKHVSAKKISENIDLNINQVLAEFQV